MSEVRPTPRQTAGAESKGSATLPLTAAGLPAIRALQSVPDTRGETELAPGTRIGRYVLLSRVGSGGMGVVWAGYDPELDRRLAVKLLRLDRGTPEHRRLRLLREAQATARLSHPNVVAVYDVGTFGGQVFMAMEYVEGPDGSPLSLGAWLAGEPRPWREVLARFVAAGQGLAAAHAAGFVHRDFKPDNVLLGSDGRVRVADFGLVRPLTASSADGNVAVEETGAGEPPSPSVPLGTPLTEPGKVLGTPAYMAPEQVRGGTTDARSDQFSFCVALHEALYGERPFAGGTLEAMEAALAGRLRPAPPAARVPAWLRQTLVRGLAAEPADRWASMDELLTALRRDPAATRRRWLAAAALLLVTAAGALGFARVQRGQELLCSGAGAKLEGVWDTGRRERMRAAFLGTGVPFAAATWDGVAGALDSYTGAWAAMHRDACEATRLRGEQSEALLDRRMRCLDQRLDEVRALSDLFTRADAEIMAEARDAVGSLGPVGQCADLRALAARVSPPREPVQRAAVEALQRDLARAKALGDAGKPREAVAAARPLAARAQRLGYPPAEAETSYVLGTLLAEGEPQEAAASLRRAYLMADRSADDELRARAATAHMWVLGRVLQQAEPAREWRELAGAAVARLPADRGLRAHFLGRLGGVHEAEGRYEEALGAHREALQLLRSLAPADDPALAEQLGGVGSALYRLGRYAEAEKVYLETLSIQRRGLGAEHPDTARTLGRLGSVAFAQGDFALAAARQRAALAIRERVFGRRHPLVADSLSDLASALDELARYDEALASHSRALAIRRDALGMHPAVAASLDNIGAVYANQRRFDRAFEYHRQALEVRLQTLGPDHPRTATTLHNLGNARNLQGRYREALPWFERALAVEEKALGADHPYVAEELTVIADIQRRLGRAASAPPLLERALRIVEAQQLDPGIVARTRFALAQALWDAGGDRRRALLLARQARGDFVPLPGEGDKVALAEIEQWLAARSDARGAGG